VIGTEVATANNTLQIDHKAFALSAIIRPITIVNLLAFIVVHTAFSVALSISIAAVIDIATNAVLHEPLSVFALTHPASFVRA